MLDTILSWTELPNLHPALVHFPFAFSILAVVFEAAATIRGRQEWIDKAATSIWGAAGLGAWAALWAGNRAARSLDLTEELLRAVEIHSDWGHYSLYAVGAIAILRLTVAIWSPPPRGGRLWPAIFLVAGLLAAGIVVKTADLGGGLVFRRGIAVDIREPARPVDPAAPEIP